MSLSLDPARRLRSLRYMHAALRAQTAEEEALRSLGQPRTWWAYEAPSCEAEPIDTTLRDLGAELGISGERTRQVEVAALQKLRKEIKRRGMWRELRELLYEVATARERTDPEPETLWEQTIRALYPGPHPEVRP